MADVRFTLIGVKSSRSNYAAISSVYCPIFNQRKISYSKLPRYTAILIRQWRNRLAELRLNGWYDIQSIKKFQYARNCPPRIILTNSSRSVRPCNLYSICPWCHGVNTAILFNNFVKFLPIRNSEIYEKGIKLFEFYGRFLADVEDVGLYVDSHFRTWRKRPTDIIKQLRPLGGFYTNMLEPRSPIDSVPYWLFSFRILAIVSDEFVLPSWLPTNDRRYKFKICTVRSKKDLVGPIMRTCRYPIGLLKDNTKMTITALNARKGCRTSALVGCLRRSGKKGLLKNDNFYNTEEESSTETVD